MRKPLCAAVVSVALLSASPASADNPKINTQTFRPSPHGSDLFATVTTDLPEAWTWSAAAWLSYGHKPLVFVDLAEVAPDFEAIQHQLALHATGAMSFTDWLSVGFELPFFVLNAGEDTGFVAIDPIPSTVLGDIRLSAKLGLLTRAKGADGFGLGLELPIGLPTGDASAFVSDGFTFVPALVLDLRLAPVHVAINLGARIRGDEQLAPGTETGTEAVFRVAAAVDVVPDTLAILGEVQGASHNFELSNNTYVEGLIGGRLDLGQGFHVTLAGGRAFTTGYGSTAARVVAQFGFTPEPAPIVVDTDGDGFFDDIDRCVTDAEDKDGWQDDDGCPDPDNDMDGILDVAERCMGESEDIDGFEDHDGCPDPDNDKDGILDDADGDGGRCKDVAEDMDGFQDQDGCPEADNDMDGILDNEDGCPNQAGRCGVVLDPCELKILDQVHFGYDDAIIQPESFPILDAIVSVLNTQPALKLIEVQGHTDGDGDAPYNLELSQKRAAAVATYLAGKGIAATRLVAKGYGETVPRDTNTTADGRAKNRRVQFIILDPVQSGCGR